MGTAYNRIVYASPPGGGSGSVRLGRLWLPRLTSPHFCGCWNAAHSFIATTETSYTTGTLDEIGAKIIEK